MKKIRLNFSLDQLSPEKNKHTIDTSFRSHVVKLSLPWCILIGFEVKNSTWYDAIVIFPFFVTKVTLQPPLNLLEKNLLNTFTEVHSFNQNESLTCEDGVTETTKSNSLLRESVICWNPVQR